MCEICSKSIINAPELLSDVFIVEFEDISLMNVVFPLLNLNKQIPIGIYRNQLAIACSKLTIESTRTRCEICSKLTIETLEQRQWR